VGIVAFQFVDSCAIEYRIFSARAITIIKLFNVAPIWFLSMVTDPALSFRTAARADVPAIVRMLADDPLGAQRERFSTPLPEGYERAFDAISRDANNELIVACLADEVIGVLQLTFIPSLTYQGGWRALIEGVRVDARMRSRGIGKALFEWAIARARERGCHIVQLTTDKARPEARRFYETLGFVASHEGMKLHLK
jgi:GNAT superfamily N-acetyltransferase